MQHHLYFLGISHSTTCGPIWTGWRKSLKISAESDIRANLGERPAQSDGASAASAEGHHAQNPTDSTIRRIEIATSRPRVQLKTGNAARRLRQGCGARFRAAN